MKNNVWYLSRERFNTLFFHIGRTVTFVIFLLLFIACNEVSIIFLNMNKDTQPWISNIFIIVASAIAGIIMVILALAIFRGEQKSNQINLELREGYKPRQIYIARIIEMVFYFAVFMAAAVIVNMATIGATKHMNDVAWYHMFVTSLGWYAIICIIGIGMGIFFSTFLNSGWGSTLATCVVLICILIGGFIAGLVAVVGTHSKKDNMDYAGQIASKKLDTAALDFAQKDLGIENYAQWKEMQQDFLSFVPASGHNKSNDPAIPNGEIKTKDSMGNDLYKDLGMNWQEYYSMMTGDWRITNPNETREGPIDPNNTGETSTWYRVQDHSYNSDQSSLYASFMAFSGKILASPAYSNEKFDKFFTASKNFFKSNFTNIKFDNIQNWSILDGNPGKNDMGQHEVSDNHPVKGLKARVGNLFSTEKYSDEISKISKDEDFTTDFGDISALAEISDATALSSMFNTKTYSTAANGTGSYALDYIENYNDNKNIFGQHSFVSSSNDDWNAQLYPSFAFGGYGLKEDNMQTQFKNVLQKLGMTPAEFIFNRDVMFYVNKAFIDMNAYAGWTPGRTIIGSQALYVQNKNELVLLVNNATPFRAGGVTYDKTGLQYGKLAKDALNGLNIDFDNGFGNRVEINIGDNDKGYSEYFDSADYESTAKLGRVLINGSSGRTSNFNNAIVLKLNRDTASRMSSVAYGKGGLGNITSDNSKLMVSDSVDDLETIGGQFDLNIEGSYYQHRTYSSYPTSDNEKYNGESSDKENFISANRWIDTQASENPTISSISTTENGVNFNYWNQVNKLFDGWTWSLPGTDAFDNIRFSDSKGDLTVANIDNKGVTSTSITFDRKPEGQVKVDFTKDTDDNFNTQLIDGSFFKPLLAYAKSETHKSSMSWIYNPLTQLQAMFNGVNYKNEVMDNLYTSFLNDYYVGINSDNLKISVEHSKNDPNLAVMKAKRNNYVEILYVYYTVLEALFVFVGYWMYRKSIVA